MRKSPEVVDRIATLFTSVVAFTAYAGVVGLVGGGSASVRRSTADFLLAV